MALDYLPSPGWAVVYGETPAADRWSELGENDDALATGVGLDDSAIETRHLANGAVTSPKIDFAYLGTKATPYANTRAITTTNSVILTADRYLFVNVYCDFTSGATNLTVSINGGEVGYMDPQRSRGNVGLILKPGDTLGVKGNSNYTIGWLRVDTYSLS